MRNYRLRGGKYEGIHIIYDSREEFLKHHPDTPIKPWTELPYDGYETGDWVEAEDGYIIQILKAVTFINKMNRETRFVRVPMGTFTICRLVNGTFRYSRMYAQFTVPDKSSGSKIRSGERCATDLVVEAKKRFGMMVAAGTYVKKAFLIAFPQRGMLTTSQIAKKVTKLFGDPIVMEQINQSLVMFKDELDEKFTNSKILEMIEEHVKNVKAGSQTEQNMIKWLMELKSLTRKTKQGVRLVADAQENDVEDATILPEGDPEEEAPFQLNS